MSSIIDAFIDDWSGGQLTRRYIRDRKSLDAIPAPSSWRKASINTHRRYRSTRQSDIRNDLERKCVPWGGRKIGYRDSSTFRSIVRIRQALLASSTNPAVDTRDDRCPRSLLGPFCSEIAFSRAEGGGEGDIHREKAGKGEESDNNDAFHWIHCAPQFKFTGTIDVYLSPATVERRHSIDFQSLDGVGSRGTGRKERGPPPVSIEH